MSLRGFSTLIYLVDDVAAATDWYAELLGAGPVFTRPGPGGRIQYAKFALGDHQAELAIADDPMATQGAVERQAGKFAGAKKYGRQANLPPDGKAGGGGDARLGYGPIGKGRSDEGTRIRKPTLDEMGPGTDRELPLTYKERPAGRSTQGFAGQRPKYKRR